MLIDVKKGLWYRLHLSLKHTYISFYGDGLTIETAAKALLNELIHNSDTIAQIALNNKMDSVPVSGLEVFYNAYYFLEKDGKRFPITDEVLQLNAYSRGIPYEEYTLPVEETFGLKNFEPVSEDPKVESKEKLLEEILKGFEETFQKELENMKSSHDNWVKNKFKNQMRALLKSDVSKEELLSIVKEFCEEE